MAKSENKENKDENLSGLDLSLDSLELDDIESAVETDAAEEEFEYVEVEEGEEASDEEYEYVEEEVEVAEENKEEETPQETTAESEDDDLALDGFNFDDLDDEETPEIEETTEEVAETPEVTEEIAVEEIKVEEEATQEAPVEEVVEENTAEEITENVQIEDLPDARLANTKPQAVLKDFSEISPENLEIKTLTDKSFDKIYKKAKVFNNNFGQISYSGKDDKSSIVLNEIDFEDLSLWNIIIFRRNEIAISDKDNEVKISKEDKSAIRIANLYGPDGRAQKLYDIEKIDLAKKDDTPVQKLEAGNFFLKEISSDWGVSVTDYTIVGLADKYGKSIEIPKNTDGLIIGPNKSVLYFDNVKEIVIAKSAEDRGEEDDIQAWLAGNENDNMYRFDAASNSDEYVGVEGNNIIHINAGYSTYGWNVVFENGIRMSLADVREYQSRHGKLPAPSGMVIRGAKTLKFSDVEKILIYEPAQYFGYGFGNPVS